MGNDGPTQPEQGGNCRTPHNQSAENYNSLGSGERTAGLQRDCLAGPACSEKFRIIACGAGIYPSWEEFASVWKVKKRIDSVTCKLLRDSEQQNQELEEGSPSDSECLKAKCVLCSQKMKYVFRNWLVLSPLHHAN